MQHATRDTRHETCDTRHALDRTIDIDAKRQSLTSCMNERTERFKERMRIERIISASMRKNINFAYLSFQQWLENNWKNLGAREYRRKLLYSQNIIFCIFLNDILWQSWKEKVFANYANTICKCNDIISDVQEGT